MERLEERNLLAVDPFQISSWGEFVGPTFDDLSAVSSASGSGASDANAAIRVSSPAVNPEELSQLASAAAISDLLAAAPFALDQTFFLHSNPSASKVVYLDFDGHITRNTAWNLADPDDPESIPVPNIVTPAYTLDGDSAFSDEELESIQFIWERVIEDFAPFNVDVTTEDPGIEALQRTGAGDNQWGIRVLIGGSNLDWLFDDGVGGIAYLNSFSADTDLPCFVFSVTQGSEKAIAETISHEVGHTLGLAHDGQIVPPVIPPPDPPEDPEPPIEYYGGHGANATGWGPIMGAPFDKELVQWSYGEYPLATNIEDDLAIITSGNGFTYRADDHGSTRPAATPLGTNSTEFFGEGIIERNTDLDYFSFTVGSRGEAVTFDINPFHRGANLDILATLYDSAGAILATSNPVDELNASFGMNLAAGTYYVSIDGTGRPSASATDYGYSDYGSLGYFSIVGTRKELLVGVDFDVVGGVAPQNWTLYTGSPAPAVLTDLKNEGGLATPFNLSITTGGAPITKTTSTINTGTLPEHVQPLTALGGYLASQSWTFTWSDLLPQTAYEVFVFGLAGAEGVNQVEIIGEEVFSFTQSLTSNDLFINSGVGDSNRDLTTFGHSIIADETGTIVMTVAPESDLASVGGLAIRPAKPGSIQGQKWNDLDGNGVKDAEEPGLPGWTIFIDENGNDQLDSNFVQTVASAEVPQVVTSSTTVKSDLFFEGLSQVSDINAKLNISHTFNGDLDVFLISPSGRRVELFTDVGNFSDNFHDTVLDDEAVTPITAGAAPFTGSFRPEGQLSAFDGENPNGMWTLEVSDDGTGDNGVLNSWSLTISSREVSTVTGADGSYSFENLAPGVYDVQEVLDGHPTWRQTFASPPVTITSGARVQDVDFGNWIPAVLPGSIAGQVWEDVNGDGIKDAAEPGLEGWTVYVDGNGNGALDPSLPKTVDATDAPTTITNFSTVTSQVLFEGLSTILDVNVTIDITHSFVGDLDAYLISPSGRQVKLFTGVGGQFNDFQNTLLDDQAETPITGGAAPFTGSFRPEGLLSDFNGEDPNGIWQLLVRDTALGDEGALNSWSLTIVGRELSTVTDEDGNYSFPEVSPGAYAIHEVLQGGWAQTAPIIPTGKSYWEIEVGSNGNIADLVFGNNKVVPLPGDYNESGLVDAADYTVWRSSLGANVTPFSGADGNGNGAIDQGDYVVWKENFGSMLPIGGAAVEQFAAPESAVREAQSLAASAPAPPADLMAHALPMVRGDALSPYTARPDADSLAPTASRTSPTTDRADAALVAWLTDLSDSVSDRAGRVDLESIDLDFIDEVVGGDVGSLAAALDCVFAKIVA